MIYPEYNHVPSLSALLHGDKICFQGSWFEIVPYGEGYGNNIEPCNDPTVEGEKIDMQEKDEIAELLS